MFLGEFNVKFTGIGRLVLPVKFRETLTEKKEIVLSRGLDGCIWGFEKESWQREAQKQLEQPVTDKQARDLRRYLFSAAEVVSLDEQGRFIISKKLLEYANLIGSQEKGWAVVVGAGDHFEIWESNKWQEVLEQINTNETQV